MHSKKFMKWFERERLMTIAKNNFIYFKNVLKECLNAKNEHLLIICDSGYPGKRIAPLMGLSYHYAAKKIGLKVNLIAQSPKLRGETASPEVIESLKKLKKGSIVALCLSNKLGKMKDLGKSYRRFVYSNDHRFISTPSLGSLDTRYYSSFVRSININYKKLQEKAKKIKHSLDWGKEVRVKTKKGTDLTLNIRGRTAVSNDADYTKKGTGGNLPAGEIYIAPGKGLVEGKVVVDGTIRHHWGSQIVKKPMTMIIEKGQVSEIKGGLEAEMLNKTLDMAHSMAKFPWGIRYVGEFGIGINPKATLLGATIMDEKVLGTAHIALGSNYWFGGSIYAIVHLDQVFKDPKIYIDGKLLKV